MDLGFRLDEIVFQIYPIMSKNEKTSIYKAREGQADAPIDRHRSNAEGQPVSAKALHAFREFLRDLWKNETVMTCRYRWARSEYQETPL